jgi:hypothetical protein
MLGTSTFCRVMHSRAIRRWFCGEPMMALSLCRELENIASTAP